MKENLNILLNSSKVLWSIWQGFFFKYCSILIILVVVASFSTVNAQTTQPITVTGTVKDASTGETLPGVSVSIEGTTMGCVTNLDGAFTLQVPDEGAKLRFSYIGFDIQVVVIGKQRKFLISLKPSTENIEEVVVVGYGVQKKESVVGSISKTTGDKILKGVQGGDLGVALTGSLPGLTTIVTNGLPGGSGEDDDPAQIFIRGKKTWNNSSPLVLVDGVERNLQDVNPYSIESISVLKDASATAVFGVRGANGVILITTRRGKEGKAKLNIEARIVAKTISKIPDRELSYMANLMKNYAIINELPVSESSWRSIVSDEKLEYYKTQEYPEYLPSVDWVDQFTKNFATDETVNMSLSGGTKFVKYFGSLAYFNEGDILNMDKQDGYDPSFGFHRFNFRSNMDFDITPTTRFSVNLSGYYSQSSRPGGNKYKGWAYLYSAPPDLWPEKYSDGTWANYGPYDKFSNGIYEFSAFGVKYNKTTNVTTDFVLDQKLDFITKGLSFNGRFSYDNTSHTYGPDVKAYGDLQKYISTNIVNGITPGMTDEEIKALEPYYTTYMYPEDFIISEYGFTKLPNTYSAETGSGNVYRSMFYQLSLNYTRNFVEKHAVSALALVNRQERATGSEFPSYREDWVGRVTYAYDTRYLFEFNGAYNGSEKFSKKYRYGFFPSMAVGWVVSNEKFFEPIRGVMNLLKFRYSYGTVGSDEGIARWLYVGSWEVSDDRYKFGYPYWRDAYRLRYEGVIPNEDIHWETAHKSDYGIETAFFNNDLRFTFDYFTEKRDNIFIVGNDRVVPQYIGTDPVSANLGKVDVHGWEFVANYSHTFWSGLSLWGSWAWTYSIDEIIERGDPELTPDYQKQAGYQIDQPREILNQEDQPLLTWNDMYNTVQGTQTAYLLPGDFALVDFNSDGIINENDRAPVGYPPRPQYTYAPSFGLSYKNFSTSFRLYGVYNVEGDIGTYRGAFANGFSIVYPWNREHAWSPEFNITDQATYPGLRYNTSATGGYIAMSRSYLKLQHAEVAYDLKAHWLHSAGLDVLRFFIGVDNILLWTNMYEDLDADRPTKQTNTRRTYPKLTRYTFGVNLNFN